MVQCHYQNKNQTILFFKSLITLFGDTMCGIVGCVLKNDKVAPILWIQYPNWNIGDMTPLV